MGDQNFLDQIKYWYKTGGYTAKLLLWNLVVFLFISVLIIVSKLTLNQNILFFLTDVFVATNDWKWTLTHPWTVFTHMFAHMEFFHALFNLLVLFFVGRIFEQYFGSRRLLSTYIVGGLFGFLLSAIAHTIFPGLPGSLGYIGASGAIMALFFAVALHRPNLQVMLFGVLPLKIIWLAIFYFAYDFFNLASNDGTAHFGHIGGALFGLLFILTPKVPSALLNGVEKLIDGIINLFSKKPKQKKQPKSKMKVKYKKAASRDDDFTFNEHKKDDQERMDAILDKISKSGYDSLSKAEKDFLFRQSNNA